tara:strand:- start:905 stop:1525 length:621 start_codon:yes stop_codon:yes gene_type:complete
MSPFTIDLGQFEFIEVNQLKKRNIMRKPLYKNKPSYNHCYFYSALFVGQDRPFIVKSNDYEYYNIRDRFMEWCNEGEFEKWGITKNTSTVVTRIDIMKNTMFDSIEAKTHLKVLHNKMDSLNNPARPEEPANLLKWLCERDERLEQESEDFQIEMLMENIPAPKNKQEYILKTLERKYSYIYKDLERQWNKTSKRKTRTEKVLEAA